MSVLIKRLLFSVVFVAFLLAAAAGGAYAWLHYWFYQPGALTVPEPAEQPVLITVERGTYARQLSRQLEAQGYITNSQKAYIAARLFMDVSRLQAGVYEVNPEDSLSELWERIHLGDEFLFSITFVEGSEFRQWQQLTAEHPHVNARLSDYSAEQAVSHIAPGRDYSSPEGVLFPSTYRFKSGTSDLAIYRNAYQRMQRVLQEHWQNRSDNLPVESPYEALILASVIEKETGAEHERDLVASVFVNRLRTGMRLQSDPTIIYGLGERYRGVIYRSDIQEHTAYNTYRIDGLPPTPIAMPGEAAIKATLNPAPSDYYYFVSRNDGTHVFSRTLAEHNRAVQKYQRN